MIEICGAHGGRRGASSSSSASSCTRSTPTSSRRRRSRHGSRREQPQRVEAALQVDDGHGLLVRRRDQRRHQRVDQLAVPARDGQHGGGGGGGGGRIGLRRARVAADQLVETADGEDGPLLPPRVCRWCVAGIIIVVVVIVVVVVGIGVGGGGGGGGCEA